MRKLRAKFSAQKVRSLLLMTVTSYVLTSLSLD